MKKFLKVILCILVILLFTSIFVSFWAASIMYKKIEIARLCYISNTTIAASRNICEENYILNKEADYEQKETRYTLDDTTKTIIDYLNKEFKVTVLSYKDREIEYLETNDGTIKLRCENTLPEEAAEVYEIPNKSDEELSTLFSYLPDIFLINAIDTINHFKVTEGIEDGIRCYIVTDKTNDGYHVIYVDREGLAFKEIQVSKEKIVFMSTRKATFNSVKPEDVAELDNKQYTLVSSEEFNEKVSGLLNK